MKIKASIYLLLSLNLVPAMARAAYSEAELKDSLSRNDWPGVVRILDPLKGQNFEHDLVLGKALLQLERRVDALKVLGSYFSTHREDRYLKLFQMAGQVFFNQETSDFYFDGMRFLGLLKFAEARERFEQALGREPGQVLVLSRLVQVELLLNQGEAARNHLKEALNFAPYLNELRYFEIKVSALKLEVESKEKGLEIKPPSLKRPLPDLEVPFVFALEYLRRGRQEEMRSAARDAFKKHPDWIYARVWAYLNGGFEQKEKAVLKTQIDRGLKHRDRFENDLKKQMQETQLYWLGYITYDQLVNQVR
jgi:tetratricopeptide (TPR) repeat protein